MLKQDKWDSETAMRILGNVLNVLNENSDECDMISIGRLEPSINYDVESDSFFIFIGAEGNGVRYTVDNKNVNNMEIVRALMLEVDDWSYLDRVRDSERRLGIELYGYRKYYELYC